jgi:hypothetical protein
MKAITVALLWLFASGAVLAQTTMVPVPPPAGYPGYPAGTWSSTYAEGLGHGVADVMQSAGKLSESAAKSSLTYAQAQQLWIQNSTDALRAYIELRTLNGQFEAQQRGRRLTPEELVRLARSAAPRRLSPGELDAHTGRISWPIVLRADDFTVYRAELERLFAQRSSAAPLNSDDYLKTFRLIDAMTAELRDNITLMPQADYSAAKRFLGSLAQEARGPAEAMARVGARPVPGITR